jgi:outer membrane lipoprotein carrier protein
MHTAGSAAVRVGMRLSMVTALLLSPPDRAQQPSAAESTVRRAVDAWRSVRTVRATFDQSIKNSLTGTTARATGDYQQQRPGKLAVRFLDPSGDRIVADGVFIWLYLPSSAPGQVIKRPLAGEGSGTVDLTGEFLDAPLEKYDLADGGSESLEGRGTRIVRLTPKPGVSARFLSARVWIDDADSLIRQFELREANGVTRRVHISSLAINTPVDEGAFRFSVPNGVRVVGG